jgi:hypothetical protein
MRGPLPRIERRIAFDNHVLLFMHVLIFFLEWSEAGRNAVFDLDGGARTTGASLIYSEYQPRYRP